MKTDTLQHHIVYTCVPCLNHLQQAAACDISPTTKLRIPSFSLYLFCLPIRWGLGSLQPKPRERLFLLQLYTDWKKGRPFAPLWGKLVKQAVKQAPHNSFRLTFAADVCIRLGCVVVCVYFPIQSLEHILVGLGGWASLYAISVAFYFSKQFTSRVGRLMSNRLFTV